MLFNDASLNLHFCTVYPNKTTSNPAQLTFLNFHLNLDVGEALSPRTHPRNEVMCCSIGGLNTAVQCKCVFT